MSDYQGKEYERVEYTPYGESWVEKRADTRELLPYKFTGKERDSETGLYYYGARYLNPRTSRWVSADPAMESYLPEASINSEAIKRNQDLPASGGVFNPLNLAIYGYASNNPVKYSDPTGRIPVDAVYQRAAAENADRLVEAQNAAMDNPSYQPNAGGQGATHCNQATYDIAAATGMRNSTYLDRPRDNSLANTSAAVLAAGPSAPSGVPIPGGRVEISATAAQRMANEGWTVIAAYFNSNAVFDRKTGKWEPGHGHLATVRPSDQPYDPAQGPLLANVGIQVGVASSEAVFGSLYDKGEVHYYYDSHQALPSSQHEPE